MSGSQGPATRPKEVDIVAGTAKGDFGNFGSELAVGHRSST